MPNEPNVTLPLVMAGTALALTGLLRLAGWSLRSMPRPVALAAVILGTAVIAGGWVVPRLAPPAPSTELTLQPSDQTPAPSAPPGAPGRITAAVRSPAGPAAGATVVLHRYDRTEEAETIQAQTDATGRTTFDGLSTGATTAYRLTTEHEGATFSTDLIFLGPGAADDVALEVATPTSEDAAVSFALDSTAVVGDAEGVQVVQIVRVRNSAPTAYAGGVRLPMLDGAEGLNPQRGLDRTRIAEHGGDLISLNPVPPGETEFVYTYGVPMRRDGVSVGRQLRYDTAKMTLLVSGPIEVDASGLRRGEDVKLGADARTYRAYNASRLGEGDRIRARVRFEEPDTLLRNVGVGAAVAVAVAVLAVPLVRRRREVVVAEPAQ